MSHSDGPGRARTGYDRLGLAGTGYVTPVLFVNPILLTEPFHSLFAYLTNWCLFANGRHIAMLSSSHNIQHCTIIILKEILLVS